MILSRRSRMNKKVLVRIVHTCIVIIVYVIIVDACTMRIEDACIVIVVYACTMTIVHAYTTMHAYITIIVHAWTGRIEHIREGLGGCEGTILARRTGLDRTSSFWNLQKAVMKHFWLLAQNHCQNTLFSLRASYFLVWTEYLFFGASRKLFCSISGSEPKTLPEHLIFIARELFLSLD